MSQIVVINCSNKEVITNIQKSFINMKVGDSKIDKNSFKLFSDVKKAFLSIKSEDTPFVICGVDGYEKEIFNLLIILERSSSFLKVKVILLSNDENSINEKIIKRKNFFFTIKKNFNKEYLQNKISETIKEQKEQKEQNKLVRYRNQNGAKIVFVAIEKYIVSILKSKPTSALLKKSVLTAFNSVTEVLKDEYYNIAHKILLPYCKSKNKTVDEKKLHCLIKERLDASNVVFVGHIYDDLIEKFSDDFLPNIEKLMLDRRVNETNIASEFLTLESLIKELQVSNSEASPLSYKNCAAALKMIYSQFLKIDCDVNNERVQESLKRLTLLETFYISLEESLQSGKINILTNNDNLVMDKKATLIKKTNSLLNKVDFILSKYLYHFSNELWRSAKRSDLIIQYFEKLKKVKMSNYAYTRYLVMKLNLNANIVDNFKRAEEYFDKLDREIIALVGDDADILHLSKKALEEYLRTVNNQRVSVFGFTKANIFEVWLKSNKPTRIVVTEEFVSKNSTLGLDYMKQLQRSKKNSDIFKNKNAFILSEKSKVIEEIKDKTEYKALKYPMNKENIKNFILYN